MIGGLHRLFVKINLVVAVLSFGYGISSGKIYIPNTGWMWITIVCYSMVYVILDKLIVASDEKKFIICLTNTLSAVWLCEIIYHFCFWVSWNYSVFPFIFIPENLIFIVHSLTVLTAFSIAGYRKGFNDHRGHLFNETMRIIDDIRPKAFLLENVKDLVSHDNGRTFAIMKEMVKDHGYSFIPKILNSMEYGNVPQNRERIYIVGFKDEADYVPESPSDEFICSYNFSYPKPIRLTKKVSDVVADEVAEEFYYTNFIHYDKLLEYDWDMETIGQWRRVYVRQNKRNVCPTLTANMGTGGHNVPIIRDSKDFRKLTPRECFLFQGFPLTFNLPDNMANSHLYKQAGNSVTVPVVKRVAYNIKKALTVKYSLANV